MGPFLKVLVKSRAFPLGLLRSGSAGRTRVHLSHVGRSTVRWGRRSWPPGSVVVAAGSCNRSCLARLLPTHSFARDRPRSPRAVRPGVARPTRISLGANSLPAPPLHSKHRAAEPEPEGRGPASTVPSELAWPGGTSRRQTAARVEQPDRRSLACPPSLAGHGGRATVMWPLAPGTRRTSCACSACAR